MAHKCESLKAMVLNSKEDNMIFTSTSHQSAQNRHFQWLFIISSWLAFNKYLKLLNSPISWKDENAPFLGIHDTIFLVLFIPQPRLHPLQPQFSHSLY